MRLWGRKSLLSSCLEGFVVSFRYWITKRQMSSDLRGNRKVLGDYRKHFLVLVNCILASKAVSAMLGRRKE